ncbi:MAG TPA: DUF3558 family protein [Chloroflexota bacterium]|nr:DUF3558 family protein [Chloroflexota bacterium]
MKTFILITFLLLLLTACGGGAADTTTATAPTAVIAEDDTAVTSQNDTAVVANPAEPIDTTTLDVCTLLPEAQVTAVVGPLRESPSAAEFIGDERGCTYLTEQGFIYTINIAPLDRWEIMTAVLTDAVSVPDLGDEALLRELPSDHALYVLLDGQAVVQVYNTTSDTAVSTQLAQIAIDTLAQR